MRFRRPLVRLRLAPGNAQRGQRFRYPMLVIFQGEVLTRSYVASHPRRPAVTNAVANSFAGVQRFRWKRPPVILPFVKNLRFLTRCACKIAIRQCLRDMRMRECHAQSSHRMMCRDPDDQGNGRSMMKVGSSTTNRKNNPVRAAATFRTITLHGRRARHWNHSAARSTNRWISKRITRFKESRSVRNTGIAERGGGVSCSACPAYRKLPCGNPAFNRAVRSWSPRPLDDSGPISPTSWKFRGGGDLTGRRFVERKRERGSL